MKYLSLLFLGALFCFAGCGNPMKSGYQKVQSKEGGYSVVLPNGMREIKGLNESASMQYGNFDTGISFMVIVDDFSEYKKRHSLECLFGVPAAAYLPGPSPAKYCRCM